MDSIRLPQWEREREKKKHIFAVDFIHVFPRRSGSPSFLLQDRRLFAPRSPAGRSKPCKGCSPWFQSVADFIISIAVAQNGCCLEQFPLPGRLVEHGVSLFSHFTALSHTHTRSVLVCERVSPTALTSCITTQHRKIILWLVFTFGDGLLLASPEYSHPKPSGGEPPIRAHVRAYEFSPNPTHRAHGTASFHCGHCCPQWGAPARWGALHYSTYCTCGDVKSK